jgi:HME family heavy-metal exporter
MGGDRKQYQVLVDPDRLQEYNVSLQEVEAAVKANNLNASGGFLEEGQGERPVRVLGRLGPLPKEVVEDLAKVPVKAGGDRPVLLAHVAGVEEGPTPKRGDAGIDGHAGVVLTVVKQPHADTRRLTEEVKAALRDVESSLPADVVINTELFQLKTFIDRGVYYVGEALVIGAVLVVIIPFLFLLNVRTTFITLTAIPLSLVVTTLVFQLVGLVTGTELSINVMSLGGIAVRNGILLVTHYFHLMKEEGEGFSEKMVLRGSLERLAPVLMTALTAGIGLIPLVVSGNKPGLEILYPVATVILGGLITSTFCEFLLHPGLFWKFSGKDAERLAHRTDSDEELLRGASGQDA